MITVNSNNINEIKAADYAVIDFWASWCGPCRMLSPIVEALSEKYAGRVTFGSVNVDDEEAIAIEYGISVIPTLFFMKKGEIVNKTVGVRSSAELEKIIEEMIG